MVIHLPPLLLTANASSIFEICAQIVDAPDPITCDASRVIVAEPMALCALVAALSRVQRVGKNVQVLGLSPHLKRLLEKLDILSRSLHASEGGKSLPDQGYLHAYRVRSEEEGNQISNRIARSIASMIPSSNPGEQSIVFPLTYLFIELIDNGLRHGRGRGYSAAGVWVAAQYHPPRGLIRLAVGDNGCGFLLTFQGRKDLLVKSHADAIRAAFRPFISCRRDVGLFADAEHQGLGLTICRDLALRSGGHVSVVTGNSWMIDPELPGEQSKSARFWQGAIVSVELTLPALNTVNLLEITNRYSPDPNLGIRFM